jgi:membrane protein
VTTTVTSNDRGRSADIPTQVPARGWKDVLMRVKVESKQDNISLLAGGVAFFGLLALVPALVALVSVYGMVADPEDVEQQVGDALTAAPEEVRDLLTQQLSSITQDTGSALGLAAAISVLVALWSASSGVKNLIAGTNAAYDEDETRGFVKLRAVSLAFTLGTILFMVAAIFLIAVVPALLAETGLGSAGRMVAGVLRWVLLFVAMMVGLSILYRYGPDRDGARWSWVSPGAVFATVLWLIGSVGFAIYTANFGKYNETYGSLGAIVVVMLWLFITALAVLLGAELNAELERQTRKDTTKGQPRAMGERQATAADTLGPTADEIRAGASTDPPSTS